MNFCLLFLFQPSFNKIKTRIFAAEWARLSVTAANVYHPWMQQWRGDSHYVYRKISSHRCCMQLWQAVTFCNIQRNYTISMMSRYDVDYKQINNVFSSAQFNSVKLGFGLMFRISDVSIFF